MITIGTHDLVSYLLNRRLYTIHGQCIICVLYILQALQSRQLATGVVAITLKCELHPGPKAISLCNKISQKGGS